MSRILTSKDPHYPPVFQELADAPSCVFIQGNVRLLSASPKLAIIGARTMTPYGQKVIEHIVPPLARSGVVIISGLAIGCDGYAHEIALREGGQCIAVLPASLDRIYPRRHTPLSDALLKANGLLLTEYPDGTPGPYAPDFLARNRLIAALADMVLIIEAAARSGTLSTARHALDLGKDIAAIPGNIFDAGSQGTNGLLQRGAYPIRTADDLAYLLGITLQEQRKVVSQPVSPEEQNVLALLRDGPRSVDQLVAISTMDTSAVLTVLSQLEIAGHITCSSGIYTIL